LFTAYPILPTKNRASLAAATVFFILEAVPANTQGAAVSLKVRSAASAGPPVVNLKPMKNTNLMEANFGEVNVPLKV
jgi:hypothetical protein